MLEKIKPKSALDKCTSVSIVDNELTVTLKEGCSEKLREKLKNIIFAGKKVNFVVEPKKGAD